MTEFSKWMHRIGGEPQLEREWLEMLCGLEYAGCRKIVKSVPFEAVGFEVLQHVMEEASHAFLLKAAAERLEVEPRSESVEAISAVGWTYFQSLDHSVSALQPEGVPYPLVSWIVERRVLEMYPAYLEATQNPTVKRTLTRILAQEKRHSTQFGDEGFLPEVKERSIAIEARLWEAFVHAIGEWVSASSTSSPLTAAMTGGFASAAGSVSVLK